jgi:hypothetical protein
MPILQLVDCCVKSDFNFIFDMYAGIVPSYEGDGNHPSAD